MRDHIKLVGAIIGLAGAQIFTLILFALGSDYCDCTERFACQSTDKCLWGMTMGEYWTKVSSSATVGATILGYAIGAMADEV